MSANTFLPISPVIPGFLVITAISQSNPMQVTFTNTNENTYIVGQLVRLNIPASYGMQQANGLTGQIIAINSNIFSLDINSSYFDVFSVPGAGQEQPATMAPAGSRNLTVDNTATKEPFQSLGNTGN